MSTIIDNFLAARAKRQPVTNDSKTVTREEFNTLTLAVAGLVEDVEAALSPENLGKALNAAIAPLVNGAAPKPGTPRAASRYLLPADDDVGDIIPPQANSSSRPVQNQRPAARPPLALKADRGFLLPEGD